MNENESAALRFRGRVWNIVQFLLLIATICFIWTGMLRTATACTLCVLIIGWIKLYKLKTQEIEKPYYRLWLNFVDGLLSVSVLGSIFYMVAANTSETNNLIRHEAGGHAFGRLGDEYQGKTYGSDLDDLHGIGWYRNVTTDQSKWNWNEFSGLAGYEDVTYYMPSGANFWCPTPHTTNSIMYNNLNKFNAPSRRIIFERIIRQTEGASAYSWGRFLDYDKRNL